MSSIRTHIVFFITSYVILASIMRGFCSFFVKESRKHDIFDDKETLTACGVCPGDILVVRCKYYIEVSKRTHISIFPLFHV